MAFTEKKKKSMWQKKQLEQCQGNYTFMNDVWKHTEIKV